MRFRPVVQVLLLCALLAAAAPACSVYYGIAKFTGLMSEKALDPNKPIPDDFVLTVSVRDVLDPPTDYDLSFDRSGRATYDVTVRAPHRKKATDSFEVSEDQIRSIWKAVATAQFNKLANRYPSSGDGTNLKQGVQTFYVRAADADKRVELRYQSEAALEKIRAAAVAVMPKGAMAAAGGTSSGSSQAPPKELVGDSATHIFHRPDCPQLRDVPAARRQPFASPFYALDYGFRPCPDCDPYPKPK